MKVILILISMSILSGCAGLGEFAGSAAGAYRNERRGPEYVYVERYHHRHYYGGW